MEVYRHFVKPNMVKAAKWALGKAKGEVARLHLLKNKLSHATQAGQAHIARLTFLVERTLYRKGKRVSAEGILEEAVSALLNSRIEEGEFRKMARTEPWRSIWSGRKADGLFGCPAVDYSDEQRALVCWSLLYDNVYEHPDCPGEDVINDDDCLDGWLIVQRRERKRGQVAKRIDDMIGNEKIRNSAEIFIPAYTPEQVAEIESLNDPQAAATKRERMAYLHKHGHVPEWKMPDTFRTIKMELNRMASERMKQ